MFIDFHTHLDWYDWKNKEQELSEQVKSFNGILMSASVDEKSFLENRRIAKKYSGEKTKIIATFGIHPQKVPLAPENLHVFDDLCDASPLIGEIGMDFCWYKDASSQEQEKVFRYFLDHCNQKKKYCVIHTKDAENFICKILEDYPDARPIIHWYDGPESVYREFIARGYYQTFGCQTMRSHHIQNLLRMTPKNLILAETDNPTAEPWLGGQNNSFNLIERIYGDIASILKMDADETKKMINENALEILKKANAEL